jgi:hypothetical protein
MAMTSSLWRTMAPAVLAVVAATAARAQQNPVCARLETQLAAFDRTSAGSSRAEQIRRYEEAVNSQQAELERQQAQARRLGCGNNGFFVMFNSEPAQCEPQNAKIQQMRANLANINAELERLQSSGGSERDGQRRAILVALGQSNCGPQYQAMVAPPPQRRGGFFQSLFGPRSEPEPGTAVTPPDAAVPGLSLPSGSYRTICVRTCDGFYWPVSYATTPDHFQEDQNVCQRSCPAAEAILFAHRNPGEDLTQAVSISGQLYSTLPNAFRYRQSFDASCSCRQPGESWAHALKTFEDNTVERGDIVVNEDRARALSQPRVDAQGNPIRPDQRPIPRPESKPATEAASNAPAPAADATKTQEAPTKPDPNRSVRSVGPTFLPAH